MYNLKKKKVYEINLESLLTENSLQKETGQQFPNGMLNYKSSHKAYIRK